MNPDGVNLRQLRPGAMAPSSSTEPAAVPTWLKADEEALASIRAFAESGGCSPLRLLSAAALHSRRAVLGELQRSVDAAVNACHSELQRRPSHSRFPPAPHQPSTGGASCLLLTLKHDEFGVIVQELCDPAQPRVALQLSSASRSLRLLMGARLAELREQHEEAKVNPNPNPNLTLTLTRTRTRTRTPTLTLTCSAGHRATSAWSPTTYRRTRRRPSSPRSLPVPSSTSSTWRDPSAPSARWPKGSACAR